MSDMMRKMLDELMGTNRDGAQGADAVKFTDPEVCKSFLLGLCPYDLFHNTGSFKSSKKLDLGVCSKVHDPALKADYELAAKDKKYDYEFEQFEQIQQFVNDCDRKVAANKKRLEETQDQETLGPEALAVHSLNEQIGIKLSEAEELGAEGNVEESMKIMAEVEELKADKRKAEDIYRNTVPATQNQQQKLRVCEICAAFLSLYDNDRRLADHFGGRLHMGFISVRDRLQELAKHVEDKREKARERRNEREKERKKEREERRERDRDREKDRDNKDRDKDKERDRDRDRDRDRHDKDRDRDRRDRDRGDRRRSERDRDRDRDRRRSRSRSKDRRRSRRSRSRERRRERDRSRSRDRSREKRRDRSRERRDRSRDRKRKESPSKETNKDGENSPSKKEPDTTVNAEEKETRHENDGPSPSENTENVAEINDTNAEVQESDKTNNVDDIRDLDMADTTENTKEENAVQQEEETDKKMEETNEEDKQEKMEEEDRSSSSTVEFSP